MKVPYPLLRMGALSLAGMLSDKILNLGWKSVTGHPAPTPPNDEQVSVAELFVSAMVSGALLGVARLVAELSTGKLAK